MIASSTQIRQAAINTLVWVVPDEGPMSVRMLGGGAAAACASDCPTMVGAALVVALTKGGVSVAAASLAGARAGLVGGSVIATTGMPAVVAAASPAFLTKYAVSAEARCLAGSRATWSGSVIAKTGMGTSVATAAGARGGF